MHQTTSSLLERLRDDDDRGAWAIILERHGPDMERVCQRVLGPGADADDALQEAMLLVQRRAGTFQAQRSRDHGRAWLLRLTTNAAIDLKLVIPHFMTSYPGLTPRPVSELHANRLIVGSLASQWSWRMGNDHGSVLPHMAQ